ncbi:unnamed protein product [Heligmosomoides polygyrus]|uniref:DDE-1 domain-containing protein n=1 Tax=Heligmosomoides polygyrus TaxID=6339 RepID=A0A183GAF8_HELPZ|nr:unnamed protein product [Heligmosomoides polygyrus]
MAIVLILVDMLVAHQAEDLLLDAPSFRCQHLCTDTPYVKQLMADFRTGWTVKSADGRVLRKPVEVRERWEEYFKELNEEFPRRQAEEEQPTEGPIPSWTQEEVLGNCGVNWLTQFFNRVTIEGKMPDDWRDSIIVPIFKPKGDASECSNYRGIKLI